MSSKELAEKPLLTRARTPRRVVLQTRHFENLHSCSIRYYPPRINTAQMHVRSLRSKRGARGGRKMRRMGHIRQRSPGSFELRYSFGRNPKTGRPRTVTTTIKGNRRAAEKELRRLLHTIDAGEHVDPIRMTVREWLVQWLGSVRTEIAPKSYERYEDTVAGHLAPALGDLPITKLAPSHIQVAYNDW